MKVSVVTGAPEARAADVLVVPIFAETKEAAAAAPKKAAQKPEKKAAAKKPAKGKSGGKGAVDGSVAAQVRALDDALGGFLGKAITAEGFTGAAGQTLSMHAHGRLAAARVVLVGCGLKANMAVDSFRKLAGNAVKLGERVKAKRVVLVLPDAGELLLSARIEAAAEGAHLSTYRFAKYLTKDTSKQTVVELELAVPDRVKADEALSRASAVSVGVAIARDLVNEPPATLTPVEFARRAQELGKAHGFKVAVMDEAALKKERMGLVLAVAAAASPYTPPRVVRLEYRPKKKATKHIALVGKGLTFDSGGLDIKPADGMLEMKIDMAGAAAVLGAMVAIGEIGPDVAVTGWLGCVENGIGGNAYHPGDILKSRKGYTVEINNTDAEGRLVLADVIDLCLEKDKPDVLVDLATLTGACMVALGPVTAGLFSDDDALAEDIKNIGRRAGEDFWRLPLNDELFAQLKTPIADMKNTGSRYGGAITAALFLKQFVDGRARWAHLDIAGPATTDKDGDYTQKGGVGFGVRTLVGLVDPR